MIDSIILFIVLKIPSKPKAEFCS